MTPQRPTLIDLDQITAAWSTSANTRLNPAEEVFQYDLAGNRTYVFDDANGIAQTYTHAPTTNRLTRFIQSEAGNPLYRDHTLAYQSDGALATRTRSDAQGAQMVQRNESFAYDAFGLIERYRVQRDVGGMQGVCAPDASSQPISEWRYRFGPLQEREQKRQYLSDVPADGLAWTYTLLGADAKQLASYNGIQGAFCGHPPTTVWLWPVEYNSYGPAHTRVIMRPGGTPEYVLHDHLGSARITLDNAARVIESQSYTAYGDHRTHDGEAARTSYIGRETDKESDLGFNGVRLYDPTYGRFLSVDPLWGKYLPLPRVEVDLMTAVTNLELGNLVDARKHATAARAEYKPGTTNWLTCTDVAIRSHMLSGNIKESLELIAELRHYPKLYANEIELDAWLGMIEAYCKSYQQLHSTNRAPRRGRPIERYQGFKTQLRNTSTTRQAYISLSVWQLIDARAQLDEELFEQTILNMLRYVRRRKVLHRQHRLGVFVEFIYRHRYSKPTVNELQQFKQDLKALGTVYSSGEIISYEILGKVLTEQ